MKTTILALAFALMGFGTCVSESCTEPRGSGQNSAETIQSASRLADVERVGSHDSHFLAETSESSSDDEAIEPTSVTGTYLVETSESSSDDEAIEPTSVTGTYLV